MAKFVGVALLAAVLGCQGSAEAEQAQAAVVARLEDGTSVEKFAAAMEEGDTQLEEKAATEDTWGLDSSPYKSNPFQTVPWPSRDIFSSSV